MLLLELGTDCGGTPETVKIAASNFPDPFSSSTRLVVLKKKNSVFVADERG